MNKRFILDSDGKKIAVILPIDEYERLIEDLHDIAVIAERRDEVPISLKEMKRNLS